MNKTTDESKVIFGKPIAILVDGGFFLKRYRRCFRNGASHDPKTVARNLYSMLMRHVENEQLYRILYYDCPPLDKKVHNPISKKCIDFSKTDVAVFRKSFHKELIKQRKVALRLGVLQDRARWQVYPDKLKEILNGKSKISDLVENEVYYDAVQKGVDIRIGLDIASLAYKKLVNRIILVSGDSDFVPAAKLARREGIDVILDPMWQRIDDKLFEHIDGLKSTCDKPHYRQKRSI